MVLFFTFRCKKNDASTSGDSLVSKLWRMVDKHLSINRVSYVPRVGEVLNSEFSMCLKTPGHTPEAVALTFELRSLGPAAALPLPACFCCRWWKHLFV